MALRGGGAVSNLKVWLMSCRTSIRNIPLCVDCHTQAHERVKTIRKQSRGGEESSLFCHKNLAVTKADLGSYWPLITEPTKDNIMNVGSLQRGLLIKFELDHRTGATPVLQIA